MKNTEIVRDKMEPFRAPLLTENEGKVPPSIASNKKKTRKKTKHG